MKDKRGNTLEPGCELQSELFGKDATTATYQGDDTFTLPGGGHMYHDQESLLDSHWVIVRYPNKKEQTK